MFNRHSFSGLGLISASHRRTTPVPAWALALVPKPTGKNETIKHGQEDVERHTMPLIQSKIKRTLWHTKKLAPKLKGATLEETLRNNWNFIFDHIRYVKDEPGKEQVRSPRRLIHDAKGDCDCFVVTLSSLLHNQRIPHKLRIMKQNGNTNWSHIYVIVPKPGGGYYTLDPVTDRFNYEAPFTATKDYAMALEYLDGLAAPADCKSKGPSALTFYEGPVPLYPEKSTEAITVAAEELPATEETQEQPVKQQAGFGWWMLLALGGLIAAGADNPTKAAAKAASGGLAGARKASPRKAGKKRIKTLQL